MHTFSRRDWLAGSLAVCASLRWAAPLEAQYLLDPFVPGPRAVGETNDTKALQRAIDAASQRGGGTVRIPAGRYVCGSLLLRSNVSLWLDDGATLAMSHDDADFLPREILGYNPHADQSTSFFHYALLVGDGVSNVAIYGEGTIDGNGRGNRGPKSIALKRCSHMSIRGISILDSPDRAVSLLGCEFAWIDGVTVQNCYSDGIDPDCSRYVHISNCSVESYDDSMCVKASGALGERRASEYITVDNCILRTASIHFKLGTESCGDFRAIAVSNCVFHGGMGIRHGNPGIALYTTDGGELCDVTISNIVMVNVGVPLAIVRGNRDRCMSGAPGALHSVRISNVQATGAKLPSVIVGLPDAPVTDVTINGFSVSLASPGSGPASLDAIPEKPKDYPQPTMFGPLPAFGLFLRHAADIHLQDVLVQPAANEQRAAIVADDVSRLRLLDYEDQSASAEVHLWFRNVRDSVVECASASSIPSHAYRIEGANTQNLAFNSIDGSFNPRRILAIDRDVPRDAVTKR